VARTIAALSIVISSAAQAAAGAEHMDVGLSGSGALIEATVVEAGKRSAPTVVLVGGLDKQSASTSSVRAEAKAYEATPASRRPFRLIAIPQANPDGAALQFPPTGVAYRENPESNALWRWLGVHGPDLVIVVGNDASGLAAALPSQAVAEVGRIPARDVTAKPGILTGVIQAIPPSEAHSELDRRRARSPHELAEQLAQYYGHDFDQPWYIQAIALIGQLRLGHLEEVKRLAEPYVDGTKDSLARPNSLVMAGHIVFTELARRTGDPRYVQLVRRVADLGFDADGRMKESMPFHDQYSDSVFMGTTIVAQAGALTGERKYFDMAARHVAFMQHLVLRPDGLYRHQPLTDAAWGRGNAFPAIGLALTLSDFPKDHPAYRELLRSYRQHMDVLARFQDPDGLWRNVIDHPGAYPEYSATAMIGFSMLRGIHEGWLPKKKYQPIVDGAWQAILTRTAANGHLVDVCESTARMKSLDEYLKRAALLGPDPRGGAMALLFATEMAGLK
jgi:unsaturated rhamnogalacturonyl hydrolase